MKIRNLTIFLISVFMIQFVFAKDFKYESVPNDPMGVRIYTLENGLKVYLSENHQEPTFRAHIAIRAGSKNDPKDATGIAHYLEHMLFKGTTKLGTIDFEKEKVHLDKITALYEKYFHERDEEKRKDIYAEINKEAQLAAQYAAPNEFDRIYQSLGGSGINAYTSNDETVYIVELPSNKLTQWAKLESERFKEPVFRLFQTELETVYEEKNRSLDNKYSLIYEKVLDKLFPKHPYGQQTTIGTIEHLKNPSIKKMYEFYNTYYVPNNMALVLSGDFDSDEAIKIIDKYFSTWKSKEVPKFKPVKEEPIKEPQVVEVNYLAEEYLVMAFRTVPVGHEDQLALQLFDMILDNSQAGLINLNLNQAQRVREAHSRPRFMKDYGYNYFTGIPKKDQSLEEVRDLILGEIEKVKKGEFEEWIIPAIVTDFEINQKSGLEKNDGRVYWMVDSFINETDWKKEVNSLKELAKVSKKDVMRVANKYFQNNYVIGFRRNAQQEVVKIEKPPLDEVKIEQERQSDFYKEILSIESEEIHPTFVDFEKDLHRENYKNGIELFTSKNPINDVFTLSFSYDYGINQDKKLPTAIQLLEKSGTSKTSAEQFQMEFYKLGSSFDVSIGDDKTTISLTGIDRNLEKSLELLQDLIHNFEPQKETLKELVAIKIAAREDSKKDDRSIQRAMANFGRYGKESPNIQVLSNEELQKLDTNELKSNFSNLLGYKHKINYVGSKSASKLKKILDKTYKTSEKLETPPPYIVKEVKSYDKPVINFFDKEIVQAKVRMEFGGEKFTLEESPKYRMYNEYFAGSMSSVVFQEIRESRALAYSAWGNFVQADNKDEQNVMIGVLGCQADKTPEAVKTFIDITYNLPKSNDKFIASKNALLNQYRTSRVSFRELIGTVQSWEQKGIVAKDPRKEEFAKLQEMEMEDVADFVKEKIQGNNMVISIVGDKNRVGLEDLEKIGEIKFLTEEDIFGY